MKEKILLILSDIKNPASGRTFGEEKRPIEIQLDGEKLKITYDREGIAPAEKRVVEDDMVKALSGIAKEENIFISSRSKDSSDVYKATASATPTSAPQAKPAQIKAGHGPAANKKRVPGVRKVIAVSSAKGGVGKSTVSVNLAFALKEQGRKVGLLDADIYGPSLPMLLNQREAKPTANDERKILPVDAYGLPFISFGLFVGEGEPVIWRGPMLGGVLNQFLFDVAWGELDYLVIDLPPGTGDMQLSLVQNSEVDGVVVVSTPQDVALLDSKKGLRMFQQVNTPVLGMIENMSDFVCDGCGKHHEIFGQGGVEKASKEIGTEFLGKIPLEMALRTSADEGLPYMAHARFEGRDAWKAYMQIAKKLDSMVMGDGQGKGLFKSIFKL